LLFVHTRLAEFPPQLLVHVYNAIVGGFFCLIVVLFFVLCCMATNSNPVSLENVHDVTLFLANYATNVCCAKSMFSFS